MKFQFRRKVQLKLALPPFASLLGQTRQSGRQPSCDETEGKGKNITATTKKTCKHRRKKRDLASSTPVFDGAAKDVVSVARDMR
jgi:hypothetical protein